MCGLFGFTNYSGDNIFGLSALTKSLSEYSAVRGTDATGIAYCDSGNIHILKEAKPAYKLDFKYPGNIKALIGHTRHSTHGSEKKNFNNHPFSGKAQNTKFALAHNGILTNDTILREQLGLPKTKIETDSYVAVQLIEQMKELNFDSLKYTAESVEGSFSFSVLDDKNNIYLVKGDSPLSIIHFTKARLYVYASTDDILYKALIDTPLFSDIRKREFETISIETGEIVKISPNGRIERDEFRYRYFQKSSQWNYGCYCHDMWYDEVYAESTDLDEAYINDLKTFAAYQGFEPDIVDNLLHEGFSIDEIEEYIYESE